MKAAIRCLLPLLVGSLTSFSCPAETPGRLFFTPEQRRQLELSGQLPERNDGFLKTPSGRGIQWIDGKPQNDIRSVIPVGDGRQAPLLQNGHVFRHNIVETR